MLIYRYNYLTQFDALGLYKYLSINYFERVITV